MPLVQVPQVQWHNAPPQGAQALVGAPPPFSPGDLSPLIWLKPDSLAALADGDPIGTWTNSGSAGMDAMQGTSSRKPTKQTVGGTPVARFDGVDDDLVLSGFSPGGDNTDISLFIVVKIAGSTLGLFDSAPSTGDVYRQYPNETWEAHSASPSWSLGWSASTRHRLTLTSRLTPGREILYRRDATAISTNTHASTTQFAWANPRIGTINLGAAGAYQGDVEELILYPPRRSDAERDNIESYLA